VLIYGHAEGPAMSTNAPRRQGLTIVCTAKLFPNLLERYLEPLDRSEDVSRILVVRHEPIGSRLAKVENVTFGDRGTLRNLGRMFKAADGVLRRESVDWLLGFNPVPWGSIGCAAAARHGVPVSLSFIGLDFKQIAEPLARPLWLAVRHARLITVTGERMRQGLVARGLSPDKIKVLPHVVDTDRFSPGTSLPDLDLISVGQLISRKRLDVVIDAVAELRDRGLFVRAGILGQGPLRPVLEQQIRERKLEDRVELLGFRNDVETVLRRARLFALVSEWEGVPFAMIEALCTGLVPIVTDVGTITDWIEHGKNGLIVPVGDVRALADAIQGLLADDERFHALRRAGLAMRSELSLDNGVRFWRDALAERHAG
jgi:glycosyltransferase involved in cell wall biosynthesis